MTSDTYIWVNGWDEFQSFQNKRGKVWSPPWIKLHIRILDNEGFVELPPETRSLLVGIWALFARSRLTLPKHTRNLSRQLNQRVTERQLQRLNDAGFIQFCSGTVLERFQDAFWNGSTLEVEEKRIEPVPVTVPRGNGAGTGTEYEFDNSLFENVLQDMP